jgi:transcriptional regulator with XRE-family HTH domain
MEEPSMNIGSRLMALRTAKNFSQGDIEKRTGLLRCYISRVENGHTVPSLETLSRWASALDVEVYQLFYAEAGEPEPVVPGLMETLDSTDRKLLSLLREVNDADRKLVLAVARMMVKRAA